VRERLTKREHKGWHVRILYVQ